MQMKDACSWSLAGALPVGCPLGLTQATGSAGGFDLYTENWPENATNLKIFVVNTPNTGHPVLGVFIILQRPRCFRVLYPNRRNRRRSLGRLWIR